MCCQVNTDQNSTLMSILAVKREIVGSKHMDICINYIFFRFSNYFIILNCNYQ
jgi:hypothetical protein